MPAFHALLPVRDEADIIGQCLEGLLSWADAIHVFDTGSVDNTWEIVNEFAARDARVRPLRKEPVYFSEDLLRGWLFNEARRSMRDDDWFLRVDADEFHHVPPPEFVQTHLRPHETVVWHQYFNFCLLKKEAEELLETSSAAVERKRPIAERRNWWWAGPYSEPRMCRYRSSMKWPGNVSFPYNAGFLAKARLPIRHYPHRDPWQLERRCLLRAAMHEDPQRGGGSFDLWKVQDWREFLIADTGGLQFWKPGDVLPDPRHTNHLGKWQKRLMQRLLHAILVRSLDARRVGWREERDYPLRIPDETIIRLQEVLGKS
jgi:glycosyltransferase involved in cell wall biosynthesis